jgi:hypothetical protein
MRSVIRFSTLTSLSLISILFYLIVIVCEISVGVSLALDMDIMTKYMLLHAFIRIKMFSS